MGEDHQAKQFLQNATRKNYPFQQLVLLECEGILSLPIIEGGPCRAAPVEWHPALLQPFKSIGGLSDAANPESFQARAAPPPVMPRPRPLNPPALKNGVDVTNQ
jgi:hypothetical protein